MAVQGAPQQKKKKKIPQKNNSENFYLSQVWGWRDLTVSLTSRKKQHPNSEKNSCQEHQPWGSLGEAGSCCGPHYRVAIPLSLWGIPACIDPEMKRKAVDFLMFDLGGVAALGSNTQLLSERVWGLQLCYLVSESPLGQGLWEQMLTSARQRENKPQHKRAGCHEIRVLGKGNREKPKLKSWCF